MARRKQQTIADALRSALAKPDANLSEALQPWDDKELTLADAQSLVELLAEQTDVKPLIDVLVYTESDTPLQTLAMLFQNESTDEATRYLRDRGMKELIRLFDAAMEFPGCPAAP